MTNQASEVTTLFYSVPSVVFVAKVTDNNSQVAHIVRPWSVRIMSELCDNIWCAHNLSPQ